MGCLMCQVAKAIASVDGLSMHFALHIDKSESQRDKLDVRLEPDQTAGTTFLVLIPMTKMSTGKGLNLTRSGISGFDTNDYNVNR